jgi:hypothetical protein
MTKEQLLKFANELNDTEETVIFAYTKFDIDYEREYDNLPPLTDEQWERFRHWMNKYVDMSNEYQDALHYALKEND